MSSELEDVEKAIALMQRLGVRRMRTPGGLELELGPPAPPTPAPLTADAVKALTAGRPTREDLLFWATGEELPSERAAREKAEAEAKAKAARGRRS